MAEVGEKLRLERIRRKISLEQVQEDTKIRRIYLTALENDEFTKLPPKVYAIGFVKRYSSYLGFSSEEQKELIETFKAVAFPEEEILMEEAQFARSTSESLQRRRVNPWIAVLIVVLLVLITVAGKYLIGRLGSSPVVVVPPQLPNEEQMEPLVPSDQSAEPEFQINPTEVIIAFEVNKGASCWITVAIDGINHYTGTLYSEEKRTFTGKESVRFRAGNAGAIVLIVDGEKKDILGNIGQVVEVECTLVRGTDGENTVEYRIY